MTTYGQFCPASKAMELLDERWTMLVVRELMLRSLSMVWRGDLGWPEALRSGRVEVQGAAGMRKAVPRWLGQSSFAAVPRPAATVG